MASCRVVSTLRRSPCACSNALLGFAGGHVLFQGGFQFRFGRLRINRLLQRIGVWVGRAADTAAALLALLVAGLRVVAARDRRGRTSRACRPCVFPARRPRFSGPAAAWPSIPHRRSPQALPCSDPSCAAAAVPDPCCRRPGVRRPLPPLFGCATNLIGSQTHHGGGSRHY